MRRHQRKTRVLAALVLGGVIFVFQGVGLVAQDPTSNDTSKPSWLKRMFSGNSSWNTSGNESESSKPKEKTFAEAPIPRKTVYAAYDLNVLTDALRLEQEAWDRRMEVCRMLRLNAGENEETLRKIDQLEQQATNLYQQRISKLGIKTPRRASSNEGPPGTTSYPSVPTVSPQNPSSARALAPASAGPFQVVNP